MRLGVARFPWLKLAAASTALGLHAAVLAMVLSSPVVQVAAGQPEALDVQFVELAPANQAPAPESKPDHAVPVAESEPAPEPAPEPKSKPKPVHKTRPVPPARTKAAPVREARPAHDAVPPSLAAASAASTSRSDTAPTAPGQLQAVDPDRPRTVGQVDYLGKRPTPVYPRLSERRGEQGRVVLRVLITPQGGVADVKVQHSSGYARLDEAAVQAMRRAHFRPYTENGVAYPARVDIPFDFVL
ncbi:MAG: energy transducer TonB [Castellaniella sp.]|uniref:energy transducer TonB n=1 Tax=Castellaniella sp. TaxID=1955812 RepID=UPI00122834D1|nr:energy transducer TonB [Castellaniella sp.]TAN29913.1 MAG: energy transducer TonB [Castellaniella sp.]